MKTLTDVLAMKEQLIRLVKQFGYSDEVRLYHDTSVSEENEPLQLIVKKKEGESLHYRVRSFLQAKLADTLGCQVDVKVYQNIAELYRFDVDQKSALITDKDALGELFGATEISLREIEGEEDRLLQRISLKNAEEYLQKKSEPSIRDSKKRGAAMHQGSRAYAFMGKSASKSEKRAKLTMNELKNTVTLSIPVPPGVQYSQDTMLDTKIAKELAKQYLGMLENAKKDLTV